MQDFAGQLQGWRGGEGHKQWLEGQRDKYKADPEGYKNSGTAKSAPLYEGIPLQEQPGHVHSVPARQPFQAKAEAAAPAAATPGVTIRRGAQAAPQAATEQAHPFEGAYQTWKSMKPDQQKALLAIPDFRKYVESKGGK
jgi:pyruvate/2-oxoglutarate dehydrogenase complex dihydrolipoamide acyltransferase (E2) component